MEFVNINIMLKFISKDNDDIKTNRYKHFQLTECDISPELISAELLSPAFV
jgi:hypothetical protein